MTRNKAQSSLEFVILVSFVIMAMGAFLVLTQTNLATAKVQRDAELIDRVMNILYSELLFAEQSNTGYRRTFYLPVTLEGTEYSISVAFDGSGLRQDIVVVFKEKTYIFFLPDNAIRIQNPELLSTGETTISKVCGAFTCSLVLE